MTTPNLITLSDPRSAAAEAYRTLRTNLMFSSVENPIQTLLVTSSVDGEGKSEALANLAVTFAQGGNKTILVDADLRRPSQHEIWGVKNQGLTTMMLDDATLANPPLVQTSIENLMVLPAGEQAPNPADLLTTIQLFICIHLTLKRTCVNTNMTYIYCLSYVHSVPSKLLDQR